MLKKKTPVLILILCVLMIFSGCVPALPANIEENSAEIKPGNEYFATEKIYSAPLFFQPTASYAKITITDDALLYKYKYQEEKSFPVEEWLWKEFPYSEEEWQNLFETPEQVFDVFQYGKLMYQPVSEFAFLLLADGKIMLVSIEMINSESHPLIIGDIELLTPADSFGKAEWEYALAVSALAPYFFDFKMDMEFSRISVSGGEGRLVDVDKPYFQLGYNIVIDDHDFIRWSPADYDGNIAEETEFDFCIFQNGDNSSWVYSGKIIISSEESEHGRFYRATLLSDDLVLLQGEGNTGGIIKIKE